MLINCPECTKQVSDTAANCPHCGYSITDADRVQGRELLEQESKEAELLSVRRAEEAARVAKNKRIWEIAKWSASALIVFILWRACMTTSDAPKRNECLDEVSAKVMAQNFVEKQLKSPSSADWCNTARDFSAVKKGDEWTVTGCVDSQNAFGAMVRTNFTVTMTCAPDGWRLVNLATQ